MPEIAFFALLALVLLFGPWIGLWILPGRLRDHQARLDERFSSLTQRIFDVESNLRDLQRKPRSADISAQPATPPPPISSELVERQTIEPVAPIRVPSPAPQTPPPPRIPVE